ncbi:MAG: purine-nucleoside phosphorylase [Sphaerochaeta sp.]
MSIHIVTDKSLVAPDVLLPGDPLRAEHIAKTFLSDVVQYNTIRGMNGFTGSYNGQRISVQGTGMGMPSFSIYAHELIDTYGAKRLIRVGTCGTISEDLNLRDVLIAQASDCDSGMNPSRFGLYQFAPTATYELLASAVRASEALGQKAVVGTVFTTDQFYDEKGEEKNELAKKTGALAIEMECAELYTLGRLKRIQALTLLTVSDSLLTGEQVPPKDRQNTFNSMIEVALKTLFP